MAAASSSADAPALLTAPMVLVDALPYIDGQYNDPALKAQLHALIAEEMKTFKPEKDYLAAFPPYEPSFEGTSLLQADWMRVCDGAPMSKIDTSRYQLDPPPASAARDPAAWQLAVDNAKAQLENQATRLVNLELLQQHGAKLWVAQCNSLEASGKQLDRAEGAISGRIEELNRKRKADQTSVAPTLHGLQGEWLTLVKKNLEIEAQTLKLEAECAHLQELKEKRRRAA